VRNALIAYAVFQGWGNTPEQFDAPAPANPPGQQLLALLGVGKEMTDDLTSPSDTSVSGLVGMPKPLAAGDRALSRPTGSLAWHYRWGPRGWPYEVIVLDCRTLRRYGDGAIQPPQLLDDGTAPSKNPDQFQAQLGTSPASGVTLVVAQTPVLGVRWIEDALQRSTLPYVVFYADSEAWSLSPNGYQLMLARLAAHNPHGMIVLSGDVHYSFAAWADYYATAPWGETGTLGQPRTARIVQLNSSAARNETGLTRDVLHVTGPRLSAETWAGFRTKPAYTSALDSFVSGGKAALLAIDLNTAPVVLTAETYKGVFEGDASPPAPDWKYRIQFAPGTRDSNPSATPPDRLPTFPSDLQGVLTAAGKSLDSLATQAGAVAGSGIVGKNNVCVVTFTGQDQASWTVQQAVHWRPDPGSIVLTKPATLTTWSDVTRYGILLQSGAEPQVG
jgi:hypothetical protein